MENALLLSRKVGVQLQPAVVEMLRSQERRWVVDVMANHCPNRSRTDVVARTLQRGAHLQQQTERAGRARALLRVCGAGGAGVPVWGVGRGVVRARCEVKGTERGHLA